MGAPMNLLLIYGINAFVFAVTAAYVFYRKDEDDSLEDFILNGFFGVVVGVTWPVLVLIVFVSALGRGILWAVDRAKD